MPYLHSNLYRRLEMKRKKPRKENKTELLIPHEANQQPNYSLVRFISKLLTIVNIGGNMSEQGADKAGLTISEGLRFLFKSIGIGLAVALIFYFLPFLAEFINAIKNG